jgi:hypothetical protein
VLIKHNIQLVFILKKKTNPPIPEKRNELAKQMFVHNCTVIPLANWTMKNPFINGYVDDIPGNCDAIVLLRPSLNAVHV